MEPFVIRKITAFIGTDPEGEGVMGAQIGNVFYPLVCADEARIASLFPIAEKMKEMEGKDFRVVQFSVRENVTEEMVKRYGK